MRKQHAEIKFQIVPDLFHTRPREHLAEFFQRGLGRHLVAREMHKPALMRLP